MVSMSNHPEPVEGVSVSDQCDICATPVAPEHSHLVDVRDRRLLCSCRACYLLFVPQGAAQGRYRAVGERYAALDPATFNGPHWDALQIPIGLAFFFHNSATQRVAALYPGAAGATESELPLEAWNDLAGAEPVIASMQPDTEAALVYRRRGEEAQAYVVPIDTCYELVAIVRMSWQGFDGGGEAHERIDEFFARIKERCA